MLFKSEQRSPAAVANELGYNEVTNISEQDPVQSVRDLTYDYVTEATDYPMAVVNGLDILCKLGTFGVFAEKTTANWSIIGDCKVLDVYGAHSGSYCYPPAIDTSTERSSTLGPS